MSEINVGHYNSMTIKEKKLGGLTLEKGSETIYLAKKEVPFNARIGDKLKVFVYNDAKGSLKATLSPPLAEVGDFAGLIVKDTTHFGAFMDWGIEKDLFVPKRTQRQEMNPGEIHVVYLDLEENGRGVVGDTYLKKHFETDLSSLTENQPVDLLVYGFTGIGARVIVNNRWSGMLYKSELFERLRVGDKRKGFIKKLREDGAIDVALRKQGFIAVDSAGEQLLTELKHSDGFIPLHDKSTPEQIHDTLGMSKKLFKKTVGVLYKAGQIEILENGIRLKKEEKKRRK